jgi:hypothetical protein
MMRFLMSGLILLAAAGASAEAASGILSVALSLRKSVQIAVSTTVGPSQPLIVTLAGAEGSVVAVSLPAHIALQGGPDTQSFTPQHTQLTVLPQAGSATLSFTGTITKDGASIAAPPGAAHALAAGQYLTILFQ